MSKILLFLCLLVVLFAGLRFLPGAEHRKPHELVVPAEETRSDAFLRYQQCQVKHWRELMISE